MFNNKKNGSEGASPCSNLFDDEKNELTDLADTVYQPLCSHKDTDDHTYMKIKNTFPAQEDQGKSAALADGYIQMTTKFSREKKKRSITEGDKAFPTQVGKTPYDADTKAKSAKPNSQDYKHLTCGDGVVLKTENRKSSEMENRGCLSVTTYTDAISQPGTSGIFKTECHEHFINSNVNQAQREHNTLNLDEHGCIPMVGKLSMKAESAASDHTYLTLIGESSDHLEPQTSAVSCKGELNVETGNTTEDDKKEYAYAYEYAVKQIKKSENTDTCSQEYAYATTSGETLGQTPKNGKTEMFKSDIVYSSNIRQKADTKEQNITLDEDGYIAVDDQPSKIADKTEQDTIAFDTDGYIATSDKPSKKAEESLTGIRETLKRRNEVNAVETFCHSLKKSSIEKDLIDSTADSDLSCNADRIHYAKIEESDYAVIPADIGPLGRLELSRKVEIEESNYDLITIEDELPGHKGQSGEAETDSNGYASIKPDDDAKCKIRRIHAIVLIAVLVFISGGVVGLKIFLGGAEPEVTISPTIYSVTMGHSVTLQCSVSSSEAITSVTWQRSYGGDFTDILSTTNPNKYNGSTVTTPSLTIADADNTDAGSYICSATNSVGTGTSNLGNLFVKEQAPNVNITPKKYSVIKGQSTTIHCHVSSYGTITSVTWKKNALPITSSGANKYSGSTPSIPSLTIDNVDTNDTGNYTCSASNNVGTGSSNVGSVTVITEPTVEIFPTSFEVSGEQPVTMKCRISSIVPVSSVFWQKIDGDSTSNIDMKTNPNKYNGSTVTSPSLTITKADPEDAGDYTCSATNSAGTGTSNKVLVYVIGIEVDPGDAGNYTCFATNSFGTGSSNRGKFCVKGTVPTVNISPSSYSVTVGGSVTIQCRIYSNLTIKSVSWRKYVDTGSTTITPKTNTYKYSGSTVDTPSLTIYNAIPDDAGSYTCSVTNSFGTGSSNIGTLSVTGGQSKFEFVVINLIHYSSLPRVSIMIYSSQSGSLQFKGTNDFHFNQNKTLNKGQNIFSLPEITYLRDGKQNKTLRIISSVPIDLSVVSKYNELYEDGSYVIPKRHLSTQYIVPTFTVLNHYRDRSQIGITSLDTPSQVNITIRTTNGSVSYNGQKYNDGEIIEQFLAPYESLQISNVHDLSGTTITASAPIAVMAGNRCGSVKWDYNCKYFIENILPVDQQDTEFIVPIIQNRPASVVRVFSYYQNNVSIFSNNSTINKVIEPGGWLQFNHSRVSYIKATSNLLVMLYPYEVSAYRSFMMTIHGKKQYKSDYFFVVPDNIRRVDTSFLSFSIYGNNTDGFEMDGKPLTFSRVTTKIVGNKMISSFCHEVVPGAHRVTNTNRHSFGLWVYGNLKFAGYGLPAGIYFN